MENINTLMPTGEDFRWYLKVIGTSCANITDHIHASRYVVQIVENSQRIGFMSLYR